VLDWVEPAVSAAARELGGSLEVRKDGGGSVALLRLPRGGKP
jgi:hypothetical protein